MKITCVYCGCENLLPDGTKPSDKPCGFCCINLSYSVCHQTKAPTVRPIPEPGLVWAFRYDGSFLGEFKSGMAFALRDQDLYLVEVS